MNRILTAALFVFMLSAPTLAETVPGGIALQAYPPVGNGDPNAISCWAWRTTPPIRGLQCARNAYWARLNAGYNGVVKSDILARPPMGAMWPGAAGGAVTGR